MRVDWCVYTRMSWTFWYDMSIHNLMPSNTEKCTLLQKRLNTVFEVMMLRYVSRNMLACIVSSYPKRKSLAFRVSCLFSCPLAYNNQGIVKCVYLVLQDILQKQIRIPHLL